MTTTNKIHILSAALLIASFFLPWVGWKEAALNGAAMPTGEFFTAAKAQYGVENPFPQISFAFYVFWLIPVAALVAIIFGLLKKNVFWPSLIAGLLSVSLTVVYFLFSKSLVEQLGTSSSVWGHIKPWLFVHLLVACILILSAGAGKWFLKSAFILVTLLATYFGFSAVSNQAQKKILDEQFESTENSTSDHAVTATALFSEFIANDTASNSKYKDKVIEVSGIVSEATMAEDSTGTIRIQDSTGNFASFTIEKSQFEKMKNLKAGDTVNLKGVFSGSIFSEILGTTQINFIRTVINKK